MRLQYFCFRGDNYITNKVRVVSLAQDTPTGPPLHPYQVLSNYLTVWEVWPAQDFGFRGDNYITKAMRVVSLACDVPTGPPLHAYQILSKYVQGYRSNGAHKDTSTDGRLPC